MLFSFQVCSFFSSGKYPVPSKMCGSIGGTRNVSWVIHLPFCFFFPSEKAYLIWSNWQPNKHEITMHVHWGLTNGSMVGGMVQNSTNQNHYQHQQPICSSTFFFYINNKIRPTSTINIIINIRNMPNSTTRENQHQQKFLFSSTTICLTTNIGLKQQNTFNNLGTNDWPWSREVGTQKF